ncbi:hypothetical protein RUM44_002171 [Polyplax serrata]|uniref:Nuclear hormone receptor HR96 n=1 Tax=Polyplax serrata TaxID=468196 RepID=A0ABR1AM44_POLSC
MGFVSINGTPCTQRGDKEALKKLARYADMSSDDKFNKTVDSECESQTGAREKVCKVCGDKALGYNFNAITCESCKAFFRRNALKNKEFKCPFNKKCEINSVTRRFCQLCRLLKCFEIGMRKEYIMSEDDKREKRMKIEKNREIKKRSSADRSSTGEPKQKHMKIEKETEDEGYDDDDDEEDEVGKKNKKPALVNLLLTASTSKQTKNSGTEEQLLPFPSPGLPESSVPEAVPVSESRTCNVFGETAGPLDSSQSRSVEIYQISKSKEERNPVEVADKSFLDSNIIKIILDSEFSKPSEVYTNSTVVGRQGDENKPCNYIDRHQLGSSDLVREADIMELTKNNKNILLEYTKGGRNYLILSKDSLVKSEEVASRAMGRMIFPPKKAEECQKDAGTPLLTSLVNSRRSSDDLRSSLSNNVTNDIFQDIPSYRTSSHCLTNSIDSILSEAIKLEYEAYTSMNSRINSRELNDAERAKLNELIVANKALLAPLEDDMSGDDFGFNAIAGCGPSVLVDVLNLTAVAIRRLIKMSKKINAFKNMCQDDQIALLKGGCTEMMILRSAMTYDPDRDSWKIPQSKEKLMNIKVDILKEAGGRVFEEHQRFLQTFDQKWRDDENIMLILSAIALFSPDRPRVVHSDVIKLEQNSYYYLLRRYLESVYQGCEARLTFLKLIHKISELHKLNEDHVRVYLDANPREIEPLLIEIFDLKPH